MAASRSQSAHVFLIVDRWPSNFDDRSNAVAASAMAVTSDRPTAHTMNRRSLVHCVALASMAFWPPTRNARTRLAESVAQITVAVIDSTGSYTYTFPSDQAESIWPGITATTAADTLQASPAAEPESSPCTDPSSFCGVFAPFSQAATTQVGQGRAPLAAPPLIADGPQQRHLHLTAPTVDA